VKQAREKRRIDDRRLAAAFRGGDLDAFSELVRQHHRRLFVIALRRAGSPEVAEDALQVALSKAYRHLAALPDDAEVGAWLATVVENAAIDQIRREVRHKRLADRAWAAAPERSDRSSGATRAVVRSATRQRGSPSIGLEQNELGGVLGAGIAALPDPYRRPLELYHLRGLPVEEVAAVLSLNVNTVKSHLARGRGVLRRRLGPELRRGGWL
jgi:RNA polymerase sigma-70 factor (ECF subfamily)